MYKLTTVLISLILSLPFCAEKPNDPVKLIRDKDTELQKLLKQNTKPGSKERREKLKTLINGIFDFEQMAKKSLSTTTYDGLSNEQKKQFETSFKAMIENTSLKKLEVYRSDSTRYEEPIYKKEGKEAHITAHTFFDGQESIIVYKLFQKKNQWRGWDLVIDDLHTTRNYKRMFKKILEKKTFEDLIALLDKKATDEDKEDKNSPEKQSKQSKKAPVKKEAIKKGK
ncbi:MAG: ABC transporter substrate-binding protein [Fibrobacteria bacterium]|nr:ABC transporter substrate-binding protein [Fibrobacteria bacterium]